MGLLNTCWQAFNNPILYMLLLVEKYKKYEKRRIMTNEKTPKC